MYQYNPLMEAEKKNKKNNVASGSENIAAAAAGLGILPIQSLSAKPALSKMEKGSNTFILFKKLPDTLSNLKVNGNQNIADYMKEKGLKFSNDATKNGAAFYPQSDVISLPIKDKHMNKWGKSIFAHELGHSAKMQFVKDKNGKVLLKNNINPILKNISYTASQQVTSTLAFAQILNCFNSDDKTRKQVGKALSVTGGITSIPMVAEEIGASIRGSKMLGLKGADKAKAFIGISSYITIALSPSIIYGLSEGTRKFLRYLKKIKKENPEVSKKLENLKQQDIKVKV